MIEWIDPDELRNSPFNIGIYGDAPDPVLVESVKAHGVFPDHPIGYVLEGDFRVIVSGHRRNQAARLTKQERVPCIRLKEIEGDELAIRERIILSNRQRVKTNEQLAREVTALADIETERAAVRQTANLKAGTKASSPSVSVDTNGENKAKTQRTRKIAAEAVGVSEATAQRLLDAGTALVKAEETGDEQTAAAIKDGLAKSARAGAEAAKPKPTKNGAPTHPVFNESLIDKPLGQVRRALDDRLAAFPASERAYRAAKHALSQFNEQLTAWRKGN